MYFLYLLDLNVDILPEIQEDPKKSCAFYEIALLYPEAEINNSKVRVKLGGQVNIYEMIRGKHHTFFLCYSSHIDLSEVSNNLLELKRSKCEIKFLKGL